MDAGSEARGAKEPERLAAKLTLARWALAWERLWPALWPAVGVIGLFLAIALLDLLPLLPIWLHILVLVLAALGLGAALWRARRALRFPGFAEARRRLEIRSGLQHRPLTALDDRLAGGTSDALADQLWRTHLARVRTALGSIRVGWPAPGLPALDRYALRAGLVLLLAVAIAVAGPQWGSRLSRALSPGLAAASAPGGLLDLWITPPAYTGQPPRPLTLPKTASDQPPGEQPPSSAPMIETLRVPVGSQLLGQVSGGYGTPSLVLADKTTPFEAVDSKAFKINTTIQGGGRLSVEQGRQILGSWELQVIPDAAPQIEFASPPAATKRGALRLDFEASDDYGLTAVGATIQRAQMPTQSAQAPIEIPLALNGRRPTQAKGSSYHDLTAHPWAGLPVKLQLKASDEAGQTGLSPEIEMTLPERDFQHPVARAIIAQRKALVADPKAAMTVARALIAIGAVPSQYHDDVVVYLALRMAADRLAAEETPAGQEAVQSLLWDTALRIEDGRLSLAERELRSLQQKLMEALAQNAPDAEIERLMAELQQAIDRYLQALMENARRNPQDVERRPIDRNAMRIDRNDLQRLLDQARQLARTGAKDAARDMLSRLQDMLENLRAMQAQPGEMQDGGEAQQMMKGMQDLIQRQQGLLDRTYRRSQRGQRPGQRGMPQQGQPGQQGAQPQPGQGEGDEMSDGDAAEQEALRRQLGEMMRQLGEMMGDIPGAFGRAERSMRDSGEALGRNAPGRAVRPQMDALEQLKTGARAVAREMMERMRAQGQGEGEGEDSEQPSEQSRDPAGRPLNGLGGLDDRDVHIPEEADVQRSREILDELLRRASERFRPPVERDYIDRLLKRF